MKVFFQFLRKNLYLALAFFILISITTWTSYKIWYNKPEFSLKETLLSSERVVMYTKANCFFCEQAKILLDSYNIKCSIIDITNNYELHSALAKRTERSSVPYIFVHDLFLGGYSELRNILNSDH